MPKLPESIDNALKELRRENQYRELFIPEGISFVTNDYLGLSSHPQIRAAAKEAADKLPLGSGGSRLLGGHSKLYEQVEKEIARFFKAPRALFFSSGYLANLAVVRALGSQVDEIISDERNHASLIDAIRLTGKPKKIIPHNHWNEVGLQGKKVLLVSESLFGMDGDWLDWEGIFNLHEKGDSLIVIDEAHAAGAFPEDGRGFAVNYGDWDRKAVVVTFGKTFGVCGAAVLCSDSIRDWIINTARTFIYTTAISPIILEMVRASLNVVEKSGKRREELWKRAEQVRGALRDKGICHFEERSLWHSRSPIVPVGITGEERVLKFCEQMRGEGLELRAIRYPTVAKGTERIRISLNLKVSEKDTEYLVSKLVDKWKLLLS